MLRFLWLLCFVFFSSSVNSADVYVSLTPSLGYDGPNCGKSVSHACNSIQTAVTLPTTRDGDVLWLLNNGICSEINVTVDKSVTIAAYNGTVTWQCSSAGDSATRALFALTCMNLTDIVFQNCHMKNRQTTGGTVAILNCQNNTSVIDHCSFRNCSTVVDAIDQAGLGGVLYFKGASLTIRNSSFVDCSISGTSGYGGAVLSFGRTEIRNSVFFSCSIVSTLSQAQRTNAAGGAVFVDTDVQGAVFDVTISNTIFSSNYLIGTHSSLVGSAVFSGARGRVVIHDVIFSNNGVSSNPYGNSMDDYSCVGALYARSAASLTMKRVLFADNFIHGQNHALSEGAAMSILHCKQVILDDVTGERNLVLSNGQYSRGAMCVQNSTLVTSRGLHLKDNLLLHARAALDSDIKFTRSGGGAFFSHIEKLVLCQLIANGNMIQPEYESLGVDFMESYGGGVYVKQVLKLEMQNCSFSGNVLSTSVFDKTIRKVGGGGFCGAQITNASVSDSIFIGNTVTDNYGYSQSHGFGGALVLQAYEVVIIRTTTFRSNNVILYGNTQGFAGAVAAFADAVFVTDSEFAENTVSSVNDFGAAYGGGGMIDAKFISVIGTSFQDNVALGSHGTYLSTGSGGGALFLLEAISSVIHFCTFAHNCVISTTSTTSQAMVVEFPLIGGAVADQLSHSLLFVNCQFVNNTVLGAASFRSSASGGAVFHTHIGDNEDPLNFFYVISSQFLGNGANGVIAPSFSRSDGGNGYGGAILVRSFSEGTSGYIPSAKFLVDDCTFLKNAARGGSSSLTFDNIGGNAMGGALAIMNFQTVNITSSVFVGNINVAGAGGRAGFGFGSIFMYANYLIDINGSKLWLDENQPANGFLTGSTAIASSLFVRLFNSLTVRGCSFSDGLARAGDGIVFGGHGFGAICLLLGNRVTFVDTEIARNRVNGGSGYAGEAGNSNGIFLAVNISRETIIQDCDIISNFVKGGSSSQDSGGDGISIVQTTSNIFLYNTRLKGNEVRGGAGNRGGGWGLSIILVRMTGIIKENHFTRVDVYNTSLIGSRIYGGQSPLGIGGSAGGDLVILNNATQPFITIRHSILKLSNSYSGRSTHKWSHDVRGGSLWIRGGPAFPVLVEIADSLFANNAINSVGYGDAYGGSIMVEWSNVTMSNVTISDSMAFSSKGAVQGGAIYSLSTALNLADVTISRCSLKQDCVSQSECTMSGAGVMVMGGTLSMKNVNITECTMNPLLPTELGWQTDSAISPQGGGGLASVDVEQINIENCILSSNSAGQGGGIDIFSSELLCSSVSIVNTTLKSNWASTYGGSLSVGFRGNTTAQFLLEVVDLSLRGCAFINGTAQRGGHLSLLTSRANVTMHNAVFVGGTATFGGAIWIHNTEDSTANIIKDHTQFNNNAASMGGGIIASEDALLTSTCNGPSCEERNNNAAFGALFATLTAHVFCDLPSEWPVNGGGLSIAGTLVDGYNQTVTGPLLDSSYLIAQLNLQCPSQSYQVGEVVRDDGHVSFQSVFLNGTDGALCDITISLLALGQPQSPATVNAVQLSGCTGSYVLNDQGQCIAHVSICSSVWMCVLVFSLLVVVVALVLLIFGFLAWRTYRRYLRWKRFKAALPLLLEKPAPTMVEIMNDPDIELLPHDSVQLLETIGQGGQGVVWKGVYRGNGKEMAVAVKEARVKQQKSDVQSFLTGVVILDNDKLGMVSKYLPNGNLADLVHVKGRSLSETQRLDLLIDVAAGLKYLHEQRLIHRDIKAANVLISESFQAVITDFGCSGVVMQEGKWLQTMAGTLFNMAPEMLRKEHSNEKVDIYSMAILINEVMGGEMPFYGESCADLVEFVELVTGGGRPCIPPCIGSRLRSLIEELVTSLQCWDEDCDRRPTAGELLNRLQRIRSTTKDTAPPLERSVQASAAVQEGRELQANAFGDALSMSLLLNSSYQEEDVLADSALRWRQQQDIEMAHV